MPTRKKLRSPSQINESKLRTANLTKLPIPSKEEGTASLDELTRHKLELEVRNLKSPPLWHVLVPALIGSIPATILAVATVAITSKSGFLDVRKERLEIERLHLVNETSDLKRQKIEDTSQVELLKDEITALKSEKQRTQQIKEAEAKLVAISGVRLLIVPGTGAYELEVAPILDFSGFEQNPHADRNAQVWTDREVSFQSILTLPEIRKLEIRLVSVDEDSLEQLASANVTGEVKFHDNNLTDQRMHRFPIWRSVTRLTLTKQPLTRPGRLLGYDKLVHLDLSDTDLSDEGLAELQPLLRATQSVNLSRTKITDRSAQILASLFSVRDLFIEGCAMSESGVQTILANPTIRSITVETDKFSDQQIERFKSRNASCKVLRAGKDLQWNMGNASVDDSVKVASLPQLQQQRYETKR